MPPDRTYGNGVPGWQAGNKLGLPTTSNGYATMGSNYIRNVGLYRDPDKTGKAPPYMLPDYATELERCNRYYQSARVLMFNGQVTSGNAYYSLAPFICQMRTNPVMSGQSLTNAAFNAAIGSVDQMANFVRESRIANGTVPAGNFTSMFSLNARM